MNLDIVVPCYNEEKSIDIFFEEIFQVFKYSKLNWRIIFVDDGSKDNTLVNIKRLSNLHRNVRYISFSRNFGKESAIYAGLESTTGDFVIVMDVDLQDPPQLIPEMFKCITDYDIVATRRVSRKGEPVIRSFFARIFYKIINNSSNINIADGARDFRLMKREVVDAILQLNEYNRFSKGIFQWVGFKTKWVEYENVERATGESSWSFWQLFKYSIEAILSFTTAPLLISTVLGCIFSIISFIAIIFIIVKTLMFGDPVSGWPSTITVILFIGGIQLFSIGVLGQYIAKTYLEVKNRPHYIVKEKK